jgi:hypothetical protein
VKIIHVIIGTILQKVGNETIFDLILILGIVGSPMMGITIQISMHLRMLSPAKRMERQIGL